MEKLAIIFAGFFIAKITKDKKIVLNTWIDTNKCCEFQMDTKLAHSGTVWATPLKLPKPIPIVATRYQSCGNLV